MKRKKGVWLEKRQAEKEAGLLGGERREVFNNHLTGERVKIREGKRKRSEWERRIDPKPSDLSKGTNKTETHLAGDRKQPWFQTV